MALSEHDPGQQGSLTRSALYVFVRDTRSSRCSLRDLYGPFSTRIASMMASLRKLLRLSFEITNLVLSHIPRWLISGIWIVLYEDRKGNWTLGRHLRVQMKRHMPGVWNK